jgi:hypothetical protein
MGVHAESGWSADVFDAPGHQASAKSRFELRNLAVKRPHEEYRGHNALIMSTAGYLKIYMVNDHGGDAQ